MGENEQQCFRPAVPDNASHTLRFGGGYGRERTAMLPSDISGQGFPYSPRFCGGYGRERTAMLPSGGSGQGFPYSALRRWVWERTNSNASVRRFRTTLPILSASAAGTGENERQFPVRRFRTRLPLLRLRRRVRERTNSNVPVWRFRAGAELKGEKTHEARNLYV